MLKIIFKEKALFITFVGQMYKRKDNTGRSTGRHKMGSTKKKEKIGMQNSAD